MKRSAFWLFLLIYLPPVLLLAGISTLIYRHEFELERDQTTTREHLFVEHEVQEIQNSFHLVASYLLVLASQKDLRDLVTGNGGPAHRRELEEELLNFIRLKDVYDQVHILDATGMERVRVNRNNGDADLVPQVVLQNKADRYYFRRAIKLPPHTIFISPMDLNVEDGMVERPFKPTIRLVMPLFDDNGKAIGIIAANYLAQNLIDAMRMARPQNNDMQTLLLNSDGYWLKGPRMADDWGFMFADGQHNTIAETMPALWHVMQQGDGRLFTSDGLFSFAQLDPLHMFHPLGIRINTLTTPYRWYVATFVPRHELYPDSRRQLHRLLWGNAAGMLFWLVVSAVLASSIRRRREAELQLLEQGERTREIVATAFNGIFTVNSEGLIDAFNPAACRVFGYEQQEVLGQPASMLLDNHGRTMLQDELKRAADADGDYHPVNMVTGLRKDGSSFPMELGLTIRSHSHGQRITGVVQDVTERLRMQEELRQLAVTDALTGLYNRRYINSSLEAEFSRARRYKLPLGLIMLDVDHFKRINDTHGHPAGDEVLRTLAAELRRHSREMDIIGRFGGEEFILLLPQVGSEGARQMAERMRGSVAAGSVQAGDATIRMTISLGVAAMPECGCTSTEELLQAADHALYDAKHGGRNRVVVATSCNNSD